MKKKNETHTHTHTHMYKNSQFNLLLENFRISPRKFSVAFGHLRQSSNIFGSLRNFFGSLRESALVDGNLLKLVHLAVVLSRVCEEFCVRHI